MCMFCSSHVRPRLGQKHYSSRVSDTHLYFLLLFNSNSELRINGSL